ERIEVADVLVGHGAREGRASPVGRQDGRAKTPKAAPWGSGSRVSSEISGRRGDDRNLLLLAGLPLEGDLAVDEREERVVLTEADVLASVERRTDLADDDAAGGDVLAAEDLHATALRRRIATVARRALTFFVSHCRSTPLRRKRR